MDDATRAALDVHIRLLWAVADHIDGTPDNPISLCQILEIEQQYSRELGERDHLAELDRFWTLMPSSEG